MTNDLRTNTRPTVRIRRAAERGHIDHGWLNAHHTFSFGRYVDRDHMGFRALRVLNDDRVAPGAGFAPHPHDNMEILTWILDGAIRHEDSTGRGGVIRPGDLQSMTAGRGIVHSERNDSTTEPVHLLQIWIEPEARDLTPGYDQRTFAPDGRRDRWQTLATRRPDGAALTIHQDATITVADLAAGRALDLSVNDDRHTWLHVATGAVRLGDADLAAGDAAAITGPFSGTLTGLAPDSQILAFDLA